MRPGTGAERPGCVRPLPPSPTWLQPAVFQSAILGNWCTPAYLGTMRFVKYVSAAAPGSRWDVAADYAV